MAPHRGKRLAIVAGTVAVLAMVAGIPATWNWLREEWYIRQLRSEDEKARNHAADILGALKSVRAVPELVRVGRKRHDWPLPISIPPGALPRHPEGVVYLDPLSFAIVQVGGKAMPALATEQKDYPPVAELMELIQSKQDKVEIARLVPSEMSGFTVGEYELIVREFGRSSDRIRSERKRRAAE